MGFFHMPLLQAISSQSIATITELNRQELSMTAWAFATLGIRPQPLLTAIAAQAIPCIQVFGMLEISNLAWAFARLVERDGQLMAAISSQALAGWHENAASGGVEPANSNGSYSLVW